MVPEKLDLIFPFVVLAYGAVMTVVLNTPLFSDLAERRLPEGITQQIKAHRGCQSNLPVASADNESGSIYASTGSLPQFCPIEQVASIRRYP